MGNPTGSEENALVLSTPRAPGRGTSRISGTAARIRLIAFASLLALGSFGLIAAEVSADPGNGNACPPSSHNPGGAPPCGFPPESEPPPETPPQEEPPPDAAPTSGGAEAPVAPAVTGGLGGVAGAHAGGHSSGGTTQHSAPPPTQTVVVKPTRQPPAHHPAKHVKAPKAGPAPAPAPPVTATAEPASNPERSTFAGRLLSPGDIELDAHHLGTGGLLALLLAALLYLPVTIFNKATEKNHEEISRWFARPKAVLAAAFAWIPVSRHPGLTLTGGVLASAGLFAFIEPGFPTEDGALQYLIGMLIGFGLVSVVFFASWRLVLHRLEPDSKGEWRIFPPYIVLAAFLVVMARLAHFIPGVVLGTVAEYEPARPLSVRTAGIRVFTTYGVLILLGLAAWFAWIPVEHAAAKEGASSLILILDSALAITFVSALESVAFGLIPMTFLDGADLYRWHKGAWAAMWAAALLWFGVVIMQPALSTYGHHAHSTGIVWFVLLFSTLMVLAIATWGFFRIRESRAAAI
jgi:hypothetical protein